MEKDTNYTVKILKNVNELNSIKFYWDKLAYNPNVNFDFYLLNLSLSSDIISPYVAVLYKGDEISAILIGRLEYRRLFFNFGYISLFKPLVKTITILNDGYLGNDCKYHSELLIKALSEELAHKQADLIFFNYFPINSYLFKEAISKPNILCRSHSIVTVLHHCINLSESLEILLSRLRSKHRSWIKRNERLLENDYKGQIDFKIYMNEQDVNNMCCEIEKVASKTYHRKLGFGFYNNEKTEKSLLLLANKGCLRCHILFINNNPAAFWIASVNNKICYLLYTGYDPTYQKYELGTLLLIKLFDQLCKEKVEKIDCGLGDAMYKQRFSDQQWVESEFFIFAPSIKAVTINIIGTHIRFCDKIAKNLLSKLQLLSKIKKHLRSK